MEEIRSLSQFKKLKTNPLLIIDFYAVWCGPCKVISPAFERLAKQHESSSNIKFAKVDVDKARDVAQACGITAMPTFQFFKDGKKVDEVKGADPQLLTSKIGYYAAALPKENARQETKTNDSKASTPMSLKSLIDVSQSRILNAPDSSSIENIVGASPSGHALASASGPRLLIHVCFKQAISPSHIRISQAKGSTSSAPSRIQIGTNIVNSVKSSDIEMDSLAKAENSQSFNIYSDEYVNGTAELKLKASKFASVKSLTIRIDANMSGDAEVASQIGGLDIIGHQA
ncbi:thiol-disulfide exchange intermediate [Xylogone sp. PMI_703]|nr:thiol-disulfide exchange intermediate [Xylogone sp. PMI_703]